MADLDGGRIVVEKLDSSLWVVDLGGDHDLSTVGELHCTLEAIFAQGTTVVLDVAGMTFLDSSVLKELILAQRRADSDPNNQLVIVAPSDGVAARLIALVDAGRLFALFESRAAALQAIGDLETQTA
jgi:anti-anti-sigma factor